MLKFKQWKLVTRVKFGKLFLSGKIWENHFVEIFKLSKDSIIFIIYKIRPITINGPTLSRAGQ